MLIVFKTTERRSNLVHSIEHFFHPCRRSIFGIGLSISVTQHDDQQLQQAVIFLKMMIYDFVPESINILLMIFALRLHIIKRSKSNAKEFDVTSKTVRDLFFVCAVSDCVDDLVFIIVGFCIVVKAPFYFSIALHPSHHTIGVFIIGLVVP